MGVMCSGLRVWVSRCLQSSAQAAAEFCTSCRRAREAWLIPMYTLKKNIVAQLKKIEVTICMDVFKYFQLNYCWVHIVRLFKLDQLIFFSTSTKISSYLYKLNHFEPTLFDQNARIKIKLANNLFKVFLLFFLSQFY